MTELQLFLNGDERECLIELLKTALRDKRVEEHRTRAPNYREHIIHQAELLNGVLQKLGELSPSANVEGVPSYRPC